MKIDITPYYGNKELYHVGELASKIIHSMQTDGEVYLYTKEAKHAGQNGLLDLLDQLCAYWNWPKNKITIDTSSLYYYTWAQRIPDRTDPITLYPHHNPYQDPNGYQLKFTQYIHPAAYFTSALKEVQPKPWDKSYYYGMFIGRASASRIRALQLHSRFKYKQHGLTSFHTDLREFNVVPEWADFFCNSNSTFTEIIDIPTPYSDIGPLMTSPITPINDQSTDWSSIYEKIGIEIVCEVNTNPDCFELSEKLLRPMYFKRPFLLISSPKSLPLLQTLGYKTFGDIFNEGYDLLSEYNFSRVDAVFDLLQELISNVTLELLIDKCKDILEHNHRTVVEQNKKYRNFNYQQYINKK